MEKNSANQLLVIRDAREEDLSRIVDMGLNFRKLTSYATHLGENKEKMHELASQLLSKDGLLVLENCNEIIGMLGFIVYSHFISGDLIAGEVFWWVEPEHRGHGNMLLDEMERRAKQRGAKFAQMIAPNPWVARYYNRRGYQFVESTHQKELCN